MFKNALGVVFCAVVAAACGSGPANGGGSATSAPPASPASAETSEKGTEPADVPAELTGSWTLVAVDGRPVPEVGETPMLQIFRDGTAAGISGVNQFQTQLDAGDGRLSFGPVATTKMAGPPEAMALEDSFLTHLEAVSSYAVEGTTLRLWVGDDEALTFERAEPADDVP